MGLLGGFKGKLIKTKKKPKSSDVVCVKFTTFSEFDVDNSTPSTSSIKPRNNNLGDIEARHSPIYDTVKVPEDFGETSLAFNKSLQIKSDDDFKINRDINNNTDDVSEEEEERSDDGNFKIQVNSGNVSHAKSEEDEGNFKINVVNNVESEEEDIEGNFKINIAHHANKSEELLESEEDIDDNEGNFKINIAHQVNKSEEVLESEDEDIDDNEGNFKINIAHQVNKSEELLESEEEMSPVVMNYSSHASSIFFGEEEEPMLTRPRNIVIEEDNLSDGSSASA